MCTDLKRVPVPHASPPAARPGSFSRRRFADAALALTLACAAISCGRAGAGSFAARPECVDGEVGLETLARRFAPVLVLHPSEPYRLVAVIAVMHPAKPMVAYHVFFEDDVFLAGRGKSLDHEIAWVAYDPVTLKATGVFTLWHRTVLETESCLMDAKASGQRPRIDVQWGQHGLLPYGWEGLVTARPRLELAMHYELARHVNRIPKASARDAGVTFGGSYDEYVTFTERIDTADFIGEGGVVRAERSGKFLESLLGETFLHKKEWPDW